MSAHGLFLKAIPVMLGQEASERHKALAREVQSLFTARNGIVHKGGSVSREDAGKHIQTAREALAHMDELTPRSVAVAAGFDEFEGDGGGPEVRLDLK
jgi:selenocysteine lyase/cysteine desulfurase